MDFSPIINKVIAAKADALMGGGHYVDGATIARQLDDQKAGLKWLTLLVAPAATNSQLSVLAALGVTVPSQWEIQATYKPHARLDRPRSEFAKAFEEKFKVAADYHAASGLCGGRVFRSARIQAAGDIDTDKVAAALNATDVTTFFGHDQVCDRIRPSRATGCPEMVLAHGEQEWQDRKSSGAGPRRRRLPTSIHPAQ